MKKIDARQQAYNEMASAMSRVVDVQVRRELDRAIGKAKFPLHVSFYDMKRDRFVVYRREKYQPRPKSR